MSLRNIRKVYGGTQLPPPGEESDEEYEPAYTQNHAKSIYAGLEVSSDSEANVSEEVEAEDPKPEQSKKKAQKKKKRQRKQKEKLQADAKTDNGLDEIDKCVMEINAVLGEPTKPPEVVPEKDPMKIRKRLFTVRQQNLDAESELTRRFGPDEDEDPKKRGRQPNLRIIAQKGYIIDTDKVYKKRGLSMALLERKNNAIYYAFEHSRDYQRLHRTFLHAQDDDPPHVMFPLEESQHRMHVEGLLETADRYYFVEEYTAGNKVIEEIISYMQQCAHPFFSVTDIRARLEYKHVENRAFHIALMKYMHMLTNKACHRTALELAKLLLNLDPSDPLAVLFIIDTIAIRAREFQWVIDAIDYWNEERDAGFLFNMQYSYALATFELAKKKKEELPMYKKKPKLISIMKSAINLLSKYYKIKDPSQATNDNGTRKRRLRPEDDKVGFEEADELLQKAMLKFPSVVSNMLQNAGIKNAKIQGCPLFDINANDGTSKLLKDLIVLYARFIWHKFIQDAVMKWLIRNASELVDKYDNDPEIRAQAKAYANVRMNLFQSYPQEILRHLSILTPLNNLIVDGAVPEIENAVSYDPYPPLDSVNIYELRETSASGNIFYEVISNLLPEQDLQDGALDRDGELPRAGQNDVPNDAADTLRRRIFTDDSDTDDDTLLDEALHMDLLDALGPLPIVAQNASGAARLYSEVYVSIAMLLQDTDEDVMMGEEEDMDRMVDGEFSGASSDIEADILIGDTFYSQSDNEDEDIWANGGSVILIPPSGEDGENVRLNGDPGEPINVEGFDGAEPPINEPYEINRDYQGDFVENHLQDVAGVKEISADNIPQINLNKNNPDTIEAKTCENTEASVVTDDLFLNIDGERYLVGKTLEINTDEPQITEDEPPVSEDDDSLTLSDINDDSDDEDDGDGNNDGEGPDDRNDGGHPEGGNGAEEDDDDDEEEDDDDDDDNDEGDGDDGDDDEDDDDDDDDDDNDDDTDSDDDDDDDDDGDEEGSPGHSDPTYYHNRMIQSLRDHAHTEYRRSVLESRVQNGVVHQHRLLYLQRQRELEALSQANRAETAQADTPEIVDSSSE